MNERIKELFQEAIDYADKTHTYTPEEGFNIQVWDKIRFEKFAELIVQECIGCCESVISDPVPESVDSWLNGGEQCIQEIKEHFGLGMSVADKKQLIKDLLGVNK